MGFAGVESYAFAPIFQRRKVIHRAGEVEQGSPKELSLLLSVVMEWVGESAPIVENNMQAWAPGGFTSELAGAFYNIRDPAHVRGSVHTAGHVE